MLKLYISVTFVRPLQHQEGHMRSFMPTIRANLPFAHSLKILRRKQRESFMSCLKLNSFFLPELQHPDHLSVFSLSLMF